MKDTVLSRVFFVCRFPTRPESAYFQWTGVHLCSCVFWGKSVGRDDPNCVRACMTSFDAENCRRRFRSLEVYNRVCRRLRTMSVGSKDGRTIGPDLSETKKERPESDRSYRYVAVPYRNPACLQSDYSAAAASSSATMSTRSTSNTRAELGGTIWLPCLP